MRALIKQVAAFGVVGVISVCIDFGGFMLLSQVFGVYYLTANALSFLTSLVINYWLSVKFVFVSKPGANKAIEFGLYVILNLVALGLNQLLMKVCVGYMHLNPALAKILVTAVVMVYNFISRKILIERRWRRGVDNIADNGSGQDEGEDSTTDTVVEPH